MIERWRLSGNTVLIAGTDLVERTLDADDIFTCIDGRLAERFIHSPADVATRLAAFDLAPDADGRYCINNCYCHDTTWQQVLAALVQRSDVVLMDLRSFQAHNQGCRHELGVLARAAHLQRVVVLTDGETDRGWRHSRVTFVRLDAVAAAAEWPHPAAGARLRAPGGSGGGALSAAIFISYRRSDAAGHAGRLFDRLAHWFDGDAVFYDLDSIDAGDTFPQRLADGIEAAKVVLVLIGPGWVDELNRRATRPGGIDYVRSEVEHALRRHAAPGGPKLIPVLLGGAAAASAGQLDPSLLSTIAPLFALDLHSFQGKNDDWNQQFVRLREQMARVPGVPEPRFRVPAGAEPAPFHVIGQSLSRHFSDPMKRLAELQRALEASGTAAVLSPAAIYGMGGVGKTQLALKYSHAYRDRYAGVWWLRAETDSSLQLDALNACRAVAAAVAEGEAPALAFKRWLDKVPAGAPAWLIVFDNAEDPASLRPLLPERGGHHVLITSRNPAWGGLATPVAAGVWSAEQGADFLARRLKHHADATHSAVLRGLAAALGGLPLALEQAAGFIDESGMAVAAYTAQVHQNDAAPLLLDEGRAATGYERSVLATLAIAFPRLGEDAAQLLRLLSFCAADPVPERLFTEQADALPAALAATARQPVKWDKAVGSLRRFGLAERVQISALDKAPGQADARLEPALQLHRLTQEVARHRLATDPAADANLLLTLLRAALPGDTRQPTHWPRYAALAPHGLHVERLTEQLALDRRQLTGLLDRIASYLQHGPALYSAARQTFERALALDRADLGEEHPDVLTSMGNLASTLWNQGDLAGAHELQQQVAAVMRRVLGEEHPDTLASMGNLASTLSNQGDVVGARALHEQVLAVMRHVLSEEHPDRLRSMGNLASTLWNQGDLVGARALEEQVLAVMRRVLGKDHPDTLTSMNNLADTLWNQGDLGGARELQEQVLAVRRRVLGEEHPDALTSMSNLANTLGSQGDLVGARELHEQVCAVRRRVLGEEHPDTLISMGNLASTLGNQGDRVCARALEEQVLAVRRRVLGEEHPDTLGSMNNLAITLWRAGERAAALELMRRAAEGTAAKLGADHPEAVSRASELATMHAALGAADPPPGAITP